MNKMKRKWLAIGIILLFVGTCIIPAIAQDTKKPLPLSSANWFYVGGSGPGNYTKIQDAINTASEGDTVFVYDDLSPYVEHIDINKTVNLLGEDRDTTEIHAPDLSFSTIFIRADNAMVRSFKIRSADDGYGVFIHSDNNKIDGNFFWSFHCVCHIRLWSEYGPAKNIISNNIFHYYAGKSVELSGGYRNIICNNSFNDASNYDGSITAWHSDYNIIKNNSFEWNAIGILLQSSSEHNIITENTFSFSEYCHVRLKSSNNNTIYHNNFPDFHKFLDDGQNTWDEEYPSGGNYWKDYPTEDEYTGVNQDEPGSDGIGDSPTNIQGTIIVDHYPLMFPYSMTKLKIFDFNFFRPSMRVTNIGDTTAFAIRWNITINGRFIFSGENSSGIAPKPLLSNGEISASTDYLLFGFGWTEIFFTAWAENAPMVSEKINGILIIFIFLLY